MTLLGCGKKVKLGGFNQEAICTAAIASIMSQEASIIHAERYSEKVTSLSYVRPADGSNWSYRCMLDDTQIVWASGNGRWRNGGADELVSFSIDKESLTILQKFSDNSSTKRSFTTESLGIKKAK